MELSGKFADFGLWTSKISIFFQIFDKNRGARGGGGDSPSETEKIDVDKWCYFPELYKLTKVLEDRRENG